MGKTLKIILGIAGGVVLLVIIYNVYQSSVKTAAANLVQANANALGGNAAESGPGGIVQNPGPVTTSGTTGLRYQPGVGS